MLKKSKTTTDVGTNTQVLKISKKHLIILLVILVGIIGGVVIIHNASGSDAVGKSQSDINAEVLVAVRPAKNSDYETAKANLQKLAADDKRFKNSMFYNIRLFYICSDLNDATCLKATSQQILKLGKHDASYKTELAPDQLRALNKYGKN